MSLFTDIFESLKSEELKTLETYSKENDFLPRKLEDIARIKGLLPIFRQLDAFYARGKYPLENAVPFFEFYESPDSTKITCLHITYRNGNIPLLIDLAPQFPQEIVEGLKREVQENSFVRIEGTTNDILVGEVIVEGEELLYSFKEL